MRDRIARGSLVAIITAVAVVGSGPLAKSDQPPVGPDLALVGVAGSRSAAAGAIRAAGGRIVAYHAEGFFEVDPPSAAADWAQALDGAAIRYAEPEQIGTLDAIPDDPLWTNQWAAERIGASGAWDRSTGSPDVAVGLVDSGIDYLHEDLAGRVWSNDDEIKGDGVDNDGNGYVDDVIGIDCRNHDVDPFDDFFHGTHVAGTIGAIGNNTTGVAGLNWDVRMMALKWTNQFGQGLVSDAVECLDYAVENGARIVNASWGFPAYSQTLADAIERAKEADVLVVTSAGNAATDISSGAARYPASLEAPNLLTASATDQSDALASFSSFGVEVDLAAPGVDIWSTQPNDDYWFASGTSFAASHVSGAAALILAAHPGISLDRLVDRLLLSTEPLPSLAGVVATGGLLDVERAIQDDSTSPDAPTISVGEIDPSSVEVSWTSPADNGASGAPVSAYRIEVSPAGQSAWASVPPPSPSAPEVPVTLTIDGLVPGRDLDVRVTALDDVGNEGTSSASFTTGWADAVFSDDLESGGLGWEPSNSWALTGERAHSPTAGWSDSPAGPYAVNVTSSLEMPPLDLTASSSPTLEFWHRYRLQLDRDHGIVEASVDAGGTWAELARFTGAAPMTPATLDLSAYAGLSDVRLRFVVASDGDGVFDGWQVDDVTVWDPDVDAPAVPIGLVATEGDGQVALDWDDAVETDLDSYVLARTTDPPEASTRVWEDVSVVATSDATDLAVTNDVTYYYRVRAVDLAGNESDPSEEVAATPHRPFADYPLTAIVVTGGTAQGDPVSHLAASDDLRYRVLGSRKGNSTSSWEGSVTIDRTGATSLTLRLEANASATGAASVYVRRTAGKGGWELRGTLTLGTSDTTFEWSTPSVGTYSTAGGLVRVRVTFQATSSATMFGTDLASVRVEY